MAAPTPQTELKARAFSGAKIILQESLSLHSGDALVLFHDEAGVAVANTFAEAARALRLRLTTRYIPLERQIALSTTGGSLPAEEAAAIDNSSAVLTCLSENLKTMPVRRQILERGASEDRPAGWMDPSLHAMAELSVRHPAAWQRHCEALTQILLRGTEAEITTAVLDARGEPIEQHTLQLALGGFGRPPVTSAGPIPCGTWSRLPAPEVSIAPIEASANGVFVLNGAFRGGAMATLEHMLLVFSNGKLEMVGGNSPRVGQFWNVVEAGKNFGGSPLSLSDIGIRMWGGSFEEPYQNLMLLSLGDNTACGGQLRSHIYETLVSRQVTFAVDGRPVVDQGRFVYDEQPWLDTPDTVRKLAPTLTGEFEVRTAPAVTGFTGNNGRLYARRDVGRKRSCSYPVGDERIGGALSDLYQHIAEESAARTFTALAREMVPTVTAASATELRGLLAVLWQHRLIEIREAAHRAWGERVGVPGERTGAA